MSVRFRSTERSRRPTAGLRQFHLKGKHNQRSHGGNASHVPDVTDHVSTKDGKITGKAIEYVDYQGKGMLKLDTANKKKWHYTDDLEVVQKGAGYHPTVDEGLTTPAHVPGLTSTNSPIGSVKIGDSLTSPSGIHYKVSSIDSTGVGTPNKINLQDADFPDHKSSVGASLLHSGWRHAPTTGTVGVSTTSSVPTTTWGKVSSSSYFKSGQSIKTPNGEGTFVKKMKEGGTTYVEVSGIPGKKKWFKVGEIEVQKSVPLPTTLPPTPTHVTPTPGHKATDTKFPSSIAELQHVSALGGSTGATLVKDSNGTQYVKKTGKSKEHVEAEYAANKVYEAVGVAVPGSRLYHEDGKTVQLTEHIASTKSLSQLSGSELESAHAKLRDHFVLDAILGNHDVVGSEKDNILIGNDGKVYRIDNGGSFDFRAQGAKKTFVNSVDSIDSMRNSSTNPNTAAIYGKLSQDEIHKQALDLQSKKQAILDATPDKYKSIVSARIDDAVERTKPVVSPTTVPTVTPSSTSLYSVKVARDESVVVGDKVKYMSHTFTVHDISSTGSLSLKSDSTGAVHANVSATSFTKSSSVIGGTVPGVDSSRRTRIDVTTPGTTTGPKKHPNADFAEGDTVQLAGSSQKVKVVKIHDDGKFDVDYGGGDIATQNQYTTSNWTKVGTTPATIKSNVGGWEVGHTVKSGVVDYVVSSVNPTSGKVIVHPTSDPSNKLEYTPAQLKSAGFSPPTTVPATTTGVTTAVPASTTVSIPTVGHSWKTTSGSTGTVTKVNPKWVQMTVDGKSKWYTKSDLVATGPSTGTTSYTTTGANNHPDKYHATVVGQPPSVMSHYTTKPYLEPSWKVENEKWYSSLTASEKKAFTNYKGSSNGLNSALRGKSSITQSHENWIKSLDTGLAKGVIPVHSTVIRNVQKGIFDNAKVGEPWRDKGYFGTSTKPEGVFTDYPVRLTVHVPAGSHGAYIEKVHNMNENEVLLPRGSRFRIEYMSPDRKKITLRLIGEDEV